MQLTVYGTPAPQGSKRHVGGGVMVESSKKVKPWREAVKHAALEKTSQYDFVGAFFDGPVGMSLTFRLARPKGHYGTGRNAGVIKDSSPLFPAVRPDIDKLARSTLDGLCDAGVVRDDSQIVTLELAKRYADDDLPGVEVVVWEPA